MLVLSGCRRAPATGPERGKELFATQGCNACHSTGAETLVCPGLRGVMGWSKPLPDGQPRNEANVKEWIKKGGTTKAGTMPSYPQLKPEELEALVAYLRTLR